MNAVYNISVIDVRNGNIIERVTTQATQQVRYVRSPAHGGNYLVTLVHGRNHGQSIVCLPGFFRAVTKISERAVLGSLTLSRDDLLRLGFIV